MKEPIKSEISINNNIKIPVKVYSKFWWVYLWNAIKNKHIKQSSLVEVNDNKKDYSLKLKVLGFKIKVAEFYNKKDVLLLNKAIKDYTEKDIMIDQILFY